MRSTDDRDQLLYVLLEDYDKPESMRSRTAMRGAAAILSRWPGHVMWVLWVVSAVTIIVCTLLAVCWVVMAPEVDETRAERSCQAEGHAAESKCTAVGLFRAPQSQKVVMTMATGENSRLVSHLHII